MEDKKELLMADLGWCIARLKKDRNGWELDLVSPSDSADSVIFPAQSVKIFGDRNLMALKKMLDEYDEIVKSDRQAF